MTLTDTILPALDGAADLSLAKDTKLNLDYDGEATFKTLTVGGQERGAGVYSATQGAPSVQRLLDGAGMLRILEGNGPGNAVIIR